MLRWWNILRRLAIAGLVLGLVAVPVSVAISGQGDPVRGKHLWFEELGCTECHGPEDDKEEPLPTPDEVESGFYDRGEGVMDIFNEISQQDMADIRSFLRSLPE